ncbi:MAG: ABC-F family ATP-binding cassette domain-containing protein [Deltaproteobacteria bacterium]|jgi:ATP-binding cassette subfamily F protein 3|nr:ABC-F family ATP-binding cassette domain-containing protein [Deltaproteobacteria bacterium]
MSLVSFADVSRFHNRQDVLKGVTLSIEAGERVGLVGRNGAGKTTVIRLIMGEEAPDSGQVVKARGLKLGYLPQDILGQTDQKLLDLVLNSDPEFRKVEEGLREVEERLALDGLDNGELTELAERHGHLMGRFEAMDGWGREAEAKKVLSGLGFSEADFYRQLSVFSGGWIMRAILAKLLVAKPDLLVLDEPTNHLDIDSLLWLESYLKGSPSALLLVSHDRVFLNNVVQKIVELRLGRADSYTGNYDRFLEEKARRLVSESAAYQNQREQIKQLEKFIERNQVRATTARRAQSRMKVLEKMDRLPQPDDGNDPTFNLNLPRGRRGPDIVAEFKEVTKSYGTTEVYRNLNLTLQRGDRLALIGPNGRGKSTLIKLLAGLTYPTSGTRKIGNNVDLGYFSQFQMESLDPNLNLIEELAKSAGHLTIGALRSVLGGFLFSGDDVFKKVSVLSGGEKTRLVLCKIMMQAPNVLLMDEPTNHLDIAGRQMLEDALDDYEGTMILISHDRHFINRLCDKIGVIENGELIVHPGNFDDYQRLWLTDSAALDGQASPSPLAESSPGGSRKETAKPEAGKAAKPEAGKATVGTGKPAADADKAAEGAAREKVRERQNEKRQSAEERKKRAAMRKPLEKRLLETEKRLAEIVGRSKELETDLSDGETYRDADRAKNLKIELDGLYAEKSRLEEIWQETALELES